MSFYIICIGFREDQGRINVWDIYHFRSCIYGDCIFVYVKVTWENDEKGVPTQGPLLLLERLPRHHPA